MPAKNGFLLTPSDLNYLRSIYTLRLATIDHLAALSGLYGPTRSYTRTQKRTRKLAAHGFLKAVTKPPRKTLYALGPEGIEALVHLGEAPETLRTKRPRETELKDLFIAHFTMVKDIQVTIMTALAGTVLRMERWNEGPALYDSVIVHGEEKRIPVRPDAAFVLRDTSRPEGKNTIAFVLEADRSTESHDRIRTKIKGYLAYADQGRAKDKWQLASKYFRVLVVTRTATRADNLRSDLQPLIPSQLRSHYVFTTLDALTLDMLLS
jgi:hypothetical protein